MLIDELTELIEELRAVLIGPIRQEVLSGIPNVAKFDAVKRRLAAFDDLPMVGADYEEAARLFNVCRKRGVQGSHVDFLICTVALRYPATIFTTDKDFKDYAKHLDLELHRSRRI